MSDQIKQDITGQDAEAVARLNQAYRRLRQELGKIVIGQEEVLEQLLLCIFARGHAILEGVPGLAKTLMVSSLSRCLDLNFARIQFTPDLMPSDITGTEVIQEDRSTGGRSFTFLKGPIFANVILADEINRTPPKTQAALLEAMQERQVSVGGRRFVIPDPFFVLATQNPIEQEGTYPLPEAQQDRFMFKIFVKYPSWDEELEVVRLTTADEVPQIEPVLDGPAILALQHIVRRVPAAEAVIGYAMNLARATRVGEEGAADFVNRYVSWGAGPRASQYLVLAAKARAVLYNRYHVSTEDIRAVAPAVLRHRIITNFNADAEGITTDEIVRRLIESIPAHQSAVDTDGRTRSAVQ